MKVYVTDKFLTRGKIREIEGVVSGHNPDIFYPIASGNINYYLNGIRKPYWHRDIAMALSHAHSLRIAKIHSLEKQLRKLRKFEP